MLDLYEVEGFLHKSWKRYFMDLKIEDLEEKLKSLLGQLQAERGIFERLVYKNKNQHRRSSYFQYLLKVSSCLLLLP